MIAIYHCPATYGPILEELLIRSSNRLWWLYIQPLLMQPICQKFENVSFKFSVMSPDNTIFSSNSACCMGHTHNFLYIYDQKTPTAEKSASRCSECFRNTLEWDETYKKNDILPHNSSLPLFWLWCCLARFLSSFGSEVYTIGWYRSHIKLPIFPLQEAPGALFHHSTCGIVTYPFFRALGMFNFGVIPRINYGCIDRWTL